VVTEIQKRSPVKDSSEGHKAEEPKQTLLLFSAGPHSRMAIPLSMVARLEEFPRDAVEYSGGKPVIRYRGQILPLIDVANHLSAGSSYDAQENAMQVVVYSEKDRSVGLVVGKVDDIVSEVIKVKRHSYGNGILGSIVIHDQVTDLLDVLSVIRTADPTFATGKSAPPAAA
jgi:two-component system chemotaxis sensor kinase CheA